MKFPKWRKDKELKIIISKLERENRRLKEDIELIRGLIRSVEEKLNERELSKTLEEVSHIQ